MMNNESLTENWYGKWWNIVNTEYPINPQRQLINHEESFITKQLKAIREKTKNDQKRRDLEREKEKERSKLIYSKQTRTIKEAKTRENQKEIETEKSKRHQNHVHISTNVEQARAIEQARTRENQNNIETEKSKHQRNHANTWTNNFSITNSTMEQTLSEDDIITRDYDVEFYMKRGLSKLEAIVYIKNKLAVKKLWSKMSKNQ